MTATSPVTAQHGFAAKAATVHAPGASVEGGQIPFGDYLSKGVGDAEGFAAETGSSRGSQAKSAAPEAEGASAAASLVASGRATAKIAVSFAAPPLQGGLPELDSDAPLPHATAEDGVETILPPAEHAVLQLSIPARLLSPRTSFARTISVPGQQLLQTALAGHLTRANIYRGGQDTPLPAGQFASGGATVAAGSKKAGGIACPTNSGQVRQAVSPANADSSWSSAGRRPIPIDPSMPPLPQSVQSSSVQPAAAQDATPAPDEPAVATSVDAAQAPTKDGTGAIQPPRERAAPTPATQAQPSTPRTPLSQTAHTAYSTRAGMHGSGPDIPLPAGSAAAAPSFAAQFVTRGAVVATGSEEAGGIA